MKLTKHPLVRARRSYALYADKYEQHKAIYLFPFLLLLMLSFAELKAQIVINEIQASGTVELKNIGSSAQNVSSYWLCNFPDYQQVASSTLSCGAMMMQPGDIITIDDFDNLSNADGELGLYSSNDFLNSNAILDYVEWGSTGHTRSSVAQAAGIWAVGDFVAGFAPMSSLEYDGSGDAATNWVAQSTPTICAENTAAMCNVSAGSISTDDPTIICVDGIPDPIDVTVMGAMGTSSAWIITDADNNILALPPSPPFDLDGAGEGLCLIWYVRHEADFAGHLMGNNLTDLTGCYDISNSIAVTREAADGGMVNLADGSTMYSNCAGNIVLDVEHTTMAPNLGYWYIITDGDDNILETHNTTNGQTLDLSGAPAGECHIWGWNAHGTTAPVMGENVSTLNDEDCESLSSNFITVYRETADGGMVNLADGSTMYSNCAGNIVLDVEHTTMAPNLGYWYIITDGDDNILETHNTTNGQTLDLSGAPAGECHIWGWNAHGTIAPVMGENVSTLNDEDCESLSSNFITVYRETADGGMVNLADGSTMYSNCAGDIVIDVMHTTTAPHLSYWYIITDGDDNILETHNTTNGQTLDLSGAPAGECHIWGWNAHGTTAPVMGENVSTLNDEDCESLSSNFITVYRETADGGMVNLADGSTMYSNCAGNIVLDVEHTTMAPNLGYWYIITDGDDNILETHNTTNGQTLDLSGAPAGECHIWGWNAHGTTAPVMGENVSTLNDEDCESLSSNFITVYRETADGGMVNLADGSTMYSNCAGNIVLDVEHTTMAPHLSYWYIITDGDDNILETHNTTNGQTLDLSGAPAGECHIWGWNAHGTTAPVMGEHVSTLNDEDCESLSSNFITVYRETADGGMVNLADGSTMYSNCAGDIVIDVMHTTTAPHLSYWYIITDGDDNILESHNTADGQTLDLSGAPAGECHIWGWNAHGTTAPVMGENVSTLNDEDCESLSSNFITVYRETADGGMVSLADGSTMYSNCAGDIVIDVMHTTTAPHLSYWYIITDGDDNILESHNTADGQTLDLSGAPAGECHIWGWNYKMTTAPVMGEHISTLADEDCEAISDNFITVIREPGADGGMISLTDGSTMYSNCAGNIVLDVMHETNAVGFNYWYIITDGDDNILEAHNTTNGQTLDLSAAPAGECHIWGWSTNGMTAMPVMGDNISTLTDESCESLSSNFITVYRETADGGMVNLADGSTMYSNCAGNIVLDVEHTTMAPHLSYWYIITDGDDNILETHNTTNGQTLDLSGAPAGECHIWGWNAHGTTAPVMGEHVSTLNDEDCESLSSNFITVYRETADGGMVNLADGSTMYSNCAGNIVLDVEHTTMAPHLSYWYIITDGDDNILETHNTTNGQTLDLSGAPTGECHIWGWNAHGTTAPVMGEHVSTLNDEDCESLSSNFITVYRETADGGMVNLADGSTMYSNCVGNIVLDVEHSTTAPHLGYWYIITDGDDNILESHNTADGQTLDLSAAPAGECHIWGWNAHGTTAPVMGEHISTLGDEDCESLSFNFITVYRETVDGGMLDSDLGMDITVCIDEEADPVVLAHETTATHLSYWYIITDENDNILDWLNSADGSTIDFNGAEVGVCHVWGWSYNGQPEPVIGEPISSLADGDCEAISENFITVTRVTGSDCNPDAVTTLFEGKLEVSFGPNPFVDQLSMFVDASLTSTAELKIYTMQGQLIESRRLDITTGTQIEQISLSQLPAGQYIASLFIDGELAVIESLVKQ